MIDGLKIKKAWLMLTFFCLTCAYIPAYTAVRPISNKTVMKQSNFKGKRGSFSMPDFAYPETVLANARPEYEKGMRSGDGLTALKAAIQMCVASSSIAADENVNGNLARFDTMANALESPWREMALLCKADLYNSIYNSQRWVYDRRELPLSEVPANVLEWSGDMFAVAVEKCVKQAVKDASGDVPLRNVGNLLVNTADAYAAGMTVRDFVLMNGAVLAGAFASDNEPLRFGDTFSLTSRDECRELKMSLLKTGVESNRKSGNQWLESIFSYQLYNAIGYQPDRTKWLDECYERFGDTRYGAPFVADYIRGLYSRQYDRPAKNTATSPDNNAARRKSLGLARKFVDKFPKAKGSGEVYDIIEFLTGKNVKLTYSDAVIPNREWELPVTLSGLRDCNILIYKFPDTFTDGWASYKELISKGKLVKNIKVNVQAYVTDEVVCTVKVPGLSPGVYAMYASTTGDVSGIISESKDAGSGRTFRVSGISYFITDDRHERKKRLYVVNAENQKPVKGATVEYTEQVYRGTPVKATFVTDADGCVVLPEKNGKLFVRKGADTAVTSFWNYGGYRSGENALTYAKILTDLSIYKPGDEMKFVAVVAKRLDNQFSEIAGKPVKIILRDANGKEIDTISSHTDSFGRVSGKFSIPRSGLLGTWRVQMECDSRSISNAMFEVADYKSPTFRVTVDGMGENFRLGDVLVFNGSAITYSGMPVAGAKVKYSVTYTHWRSWWGMSDSQQECFGTSVTDTNGKFVITLPTATLENTPYAKGLFILKTEVTDNAGETQQAPSTMFSVASPFNIKADIPARINAGNLTECNVTVVDMTGRPVSKNIDYTISDSEGKSVSKGEFMSGSFKPDFSNLPSGRYKLTLILAGDTVADNPTESSCEFILWRSNDRRPPVETPLWTPVLTINADKNEKQISIPVGSSYDNSYIYCTLDDGANTLQRKWLEVSNGFVQVKVDVPGADSRMFINLVGMHSLKAESVRVEVVPWEQRQQVEITAETFRDKLDPGSREQWKFRFTVDGKPMSGRPAMAVMTNQALNALRPFAWQLNPAGLRTWNTNVSIDERNITWCNPYFSSRVRFNGKDYSRFRFPAFNTYGRSLFNNMRYDYVMVRETAMATTMSSDDLDGQVSEMKMSRSAAPRMAAGAVYNKAENVGSAEESAEDSDEIGVEGITDFSDTETRPVEIPLAFFMPDLITDGDGVATVGFNVPQFNGTWQFQIAGYDKEMRGNVKMLTAVASKKVMVRMNAPRFLRTGDKTSVSATLFNNSNATLPVSGRIEVVDDKGNVIKVRDYKGEPMEASASRTVTLDFTVPSNMSELSIRAYAAGSGYKDGEGILLPVLPSSTPVVESAPFYIGKGAGQLKVNMPPKISDASVTLQYCGNPVWECVTALPAVITPDSENILAQVNALYGNAIASGLVAKYPRIGEALRTFATPENASDSSLVSNLEKNAALKIVELNNTPWVNNAADETRRMQLLVKYTDSDEAARAIASIMNVLKNRQNNDGGWSWCDNMPTSCYITSRVLLHFAMLRGMGFLPDGGDDMAGKAFGYVDRELVRQWEKTGRKSFSTSELLNYLYIKSFFPDVKDLNGFSQLRTVALKTIAAEWKNFDIYDKATMVTLEHRIGNRSLTADVLESLRQYATVTPERGMCFMNLKGTWSGWNPLITTAQVLEAYAEAAPHAEAVDQLRQWLVMSKQTLDWGAMQGTAEVVQALLASGSDWTLPQKPATLSINGKAVELPNRVRLTDSFTVTLTTEQVMKGNIVIDKPGAAPAWGGVISQYVAPILDARSQSVPQLAIEKNIYGMEDGKAVRGNMKAGDKVKVTLTITTDRDMDYLVITDNRSACLEPVGQLSGYTSSDGLWYYREVRDAVTNLFIPFIGKGTHVISYECYIDRAGEYTLGIAQAQSQYAPVITAHSAGVLLKVK